MWFGLKHLKLRHKMVWRKKVILAKYISCDIGLLDGESFILSVIK